MPTRTQSPSPRVPTSPRRSSRSDDLGGPVLHGKMIADEEVVDPRAENAADTRCDDRYPPPRVAGAEDLAAPAGDEREQARTEIARRVDRVAGVEAEGRADQHDEQTHDDRREPGRHWRVAAVHDAEDHGDEQRGADDLIDEAAHRGQERLRIRRPDAGRALRPEHLPDA